jgi:pyrroline-5-carboxylate reductase
MKSQTVGFIGGGRVARILLEGWTRAQQLPATVVVFDPNPDALGKLKSRVPGITIAADNTQAAAQEIVFIAVHPPVLAEAVASIRGALQPGALLVSLAPKFTIARIGALLDGFQRVSRVIPNAPSIIGQGYNPVAFGPALSAAEKAELLALLAPLGDSPEVAEPQLEAYALLSGMGPTYLWFQLQVLRELAGGFGLEEAAITPALKRMVCGSTRTLLESGLSAAEVMDLVPVKPLAEMEPQVSEMYRSKLPAVYQKIRP